MPKEVHYLLFSNDELRECLSDYLTSHAASGAERYEIVQEVALFETPEGGVGARIKLRKLQNNEPDEREFVASDMVRALLLYCGKLDIPIAQRAHKATEAFGKQIALMMTVDFPKRPPTVSDRQVRYTGADAQEARSRARRRSTAT
jgi:hypothetical protein